MEMSVVESPPLHLQVEEASQVAGARREVEELARRLGFDSAGVARVAITVTELATNLLKHAGRGELIVRSVHRAGQDGIEILAIDRGAGMDVTASSVDGYSTSGSRGTGLGSVRRQSDEFDSYSTESGTVIVSRRWVDPGRRSPASLRTGVISLAKPGSPICGDGWLVDEGDERSLIVVADGLGHGPLASEAAAAVLSLVRQMRGQNPARILHAAHESLRQTRGAAVAIAALDRRSGSLLFAGLGNVAARLAMAGETHHLVAHNGTAGREIRAIHEYRHPWLKGALLILHTDGMGGHWSLDRHPGLLERDPAVIAGVLYRENNRRDDDVTILVASAAGRESV